MHKYALRINKNESAHSCFQYKRELNFDQHTLEDDQPNLQDVDTKSCGQFWPDVIILINQFELICCNQKLNYNFVNI